MPEAFTYHDMARMIKARIPDEGADYQLVLHPCFSQMVYKTFVAKSQRKAGSAKGKEMIKHPDRFEPDPSKGSYRNLKVLDATKYTLTSGDGHDILDAPTSMSFRIRPEDIRSHGKNLVISLRPDLHIRVHCFLHGHVLPMSTAEYTATTRRWHKSGASIRKTPPHIPVAIIEQDWNIVVVDHNRLRQTTFIKGPNWRDPTRGPCPITEPTQFRSRLLGVPMNGALADKRIYNWIIGDQKLFNGMGISHTNEVLHRAWIHPDTTARTAWASSKTRIIDEMLKYCQIALSKEYCHFVPAKPNRYSAFSFSAGVTRFYNSSFTKVFRKTKPKTMVRVEMDHYNHLVKEGLLDPKYQLAEVPTNHKERITDGPPMKEIPVYCWQQSVIRGPFVYTVICYPPIVNHGALSKLLEFDEAGKKALNGVGAAAELGIASFMDVKWFEKEIEKKRKKGGKGQKGRPKKTQIHTGQRGKPRKNVDPTNVFLIGEREQMLAEQTAAAAAAADDEEEEENDEAEEAIGGMDDLDLLEHMNGLSAEEMEEQLEMMDI